MATFYQEFYNLPKEESSPIFNTECIREVNATFVKKKYVKYILMEDGRKIAVNTFIGFDPAIKLKADSDSSAICAIAVDSNENYYILDIHGVKVKETVLILKKRPTFYFFFHIVKLMYILIQNPTKFRTRF
jgi:hypothetical protein